MAVSLHGVKYPGHFFLTHVLQEASRHTFHELQDGIINHLLYPSEPLKRLEAECFDHTWTEKGTRHVVSLHQPMASLPSDGVAHAPGIGPGSKDAAVGIDGNGAYPSCTPAPIRPGHHFMSLLGKLITHLGGETAFNAYFIG